MATRLSHGLLSLIGSGAAALALYAAPAKADGLAPDVRAAVSARADVRPAGWSFSFGTPYPYARDWDDAYVQPYAYPYGYGYARPDYGYPAYPRYGYPAYPRYGYAPPPPQVWGGGFHRGGWGWGGGWRGEHHHGWR